MGLSGFLEGNDSKFCNADVTLGCGTLHCETGREESLLSVERPTSVKGQKRRFGNRSVISGLSRQADYIAARPDFASGPEAVILNCLESLRGALD